MFSVARDKVLKQSVWTTSPEDEVEYIEAWKFSESPEAPTRNFRHGFLKDWEIDDWLMQVGVHRPPNPPGPGARLEGGIRLLISERVYYRPLSFSMSKASFLKVEQHFQLPPATLASFAKEGGVFSRYIATDERDRDTVKQIGMVIKATQKYQVANYGLALSHDFSTGFTTGLLHGTGAMPGGADHNMWPQGQSAEILDLIRAVPSSWADPMFLPAVLLDHHIRRTEQFCGIFLDNKVLDLQSALGFARAGRLHGHGPVRDPVGQKTIHQTKLNLRVLTGEMSTYMTELIWYCGVSQWQCDCLDFLKRTVEELSRSPGIQGRARDTTEIREFLDHLTSTARTLKGYNGRLKEILGSEFNVLYSIIAQIDNRLNAKMAASSSRDSTAMKMLAFITTLFLPGTFVATMLGMSMFDWHATGSGQSSGPVVSSYFWVYWVTTILLTIFVAVGWRVWWGWEKRNFDRDVLQEIENSEEPSLTPRKPRRARS